MIRGTSLSHHKQNIVGCTDSTAHDIFIAIEQSGADLPVLNTHFNVYNIVVCPFIIR